MKRREKKYCALKKENLNRNVLMIICYIKNSSYHFVQVSSSESGILYILYTGVNTHFYTMTNGSRLKRMQAGRPFNLSYA